MLNITVKTDLFYHFDFISIQRDVFMIYVDFCGKKNVIFLFFRSLIKTKVILNM